VLHPHAGDLVRPVDLRVERRHLINRAERERVGLLELTHALHELCVHQHRARELRVRDRSPRFDLFDRILLQQVAMLVEQRP
jgi:hypothetical protein